VGDIKKQGRNLRGGGVWGGVTPPHPQSTNHLDWQGESSGLAGQSKILNDTMYPVLSNLQGFQRELNRIYRPKFYRYCSKNKEFNSNLYGKIFLTLNLTADLCPEKFFRPFFLMSGKNFFNLANIFGKNSGQK
jgi:hypothetical protein